jgi:LPS export ABC transporter permease LptF/LPS export ABC transporter permease LptG
MTQAMRKPSILFKYFLKETIPFFLLAFIILTTLVVAQQAGRLSELILASSPPSSLIFQVIGWIIPSVVTITLPMALLLGVMIALNRISADSELVVAMASGQSLFHLARPLILLALAGAIFSAILTLSVVPRSYRAIKALRTRILLQELGSQIKPQSLNTNFPGYLLYVQDIDLRNGEWLGVFLLQENAESHNSRLLTARRGQLRISDGPKTALDLQLSDGLSVTTSSDFSQHDLTSFQALYIRLSDLGEAFPALQADDAQPAQELKFQNLRARVAKRPAPEAPIDRQALVELHKRFAVPFASIALVLLAIPIGAAASRHSGRAMGIAIGFALALIYYLVLIAGQNLALSGALPAWLGVWLANGVSLLLAIALVTSRLQISDFNPASLIRSLGRLKPRLSTPAPVSTSRSVSGGRRQLASLINLINYLILSEFTKYLLLGLVILVLTSIVFTLFDLIPSIARNGVSARYAGIYLVYLAPQITYFVAPFAVLLALLASFNLLARSNQLTILFGSGQSVLRLVGPVILFTTALSVALYVASNHILPGTNQEQDTRYHHIKGRKLEQATLAFGKKWVHGSQEMIYGYQFISDTNQLFNVTAYQIDSRSRELRKIDHWDQASPLGGSRWSTSAGWQYLIGESLTGNYQKAGPGTIEIPDGPQLFKRTVNESSKMSYSDLRVYVRQLAAMGAPTRSLRVDLEKKVSFPFSCITLMALALPFAINSQRHSRRGTLAGLGFSIVIGLLFWSVTSLFEMAGRQGWLPIWMAAWGSQMLFLAAGTLLFFRRRI